jgi:hypothetical protein
MKKEMNKNGVVTLQIKLTRAEHNKASRAKGTEQTWVGFINEYTELLLNKKQEQRRQ